MTLCCKMKQTDAPQAHLFGLALVGQLRHQRGGAHRQPPHLVARPLQRRLRARGRLRLAVDR